MKQGFSLIELVIALFMAALISLSLFQLLSTTRRSVRRITSVIEHDIPFIAFYNQLEKDVMSMFAPRSSVAAYAAQEKGKEQPKAEKNIFAIEGKADSFFWSFITTGAFKVLDKDGSIVAAPSVRRVAYMMEKDPNRPELKRLIYRLSDNDISLESIKSPKFSRSYELIAGIKSFEIECTLIEIVEQKGEPGKKPDAQASQNKPGADKKAPSTTIIKEWNEDEIWKKYKSLIPAFVRIRGIVADITGIEYPFEFFFKVLAYNPYKEKDQKKEQDQNLFEKITKIAEGVFKPKK